MKSSWMLVAGLLFGLMGVFVKLGAAHFSHAELVFYRSLFGLLLICAIMRRQRVGFATRHWRCFSTASPCCRSPPPSRSTTPRRCSSPSLPCWCSRTNFTRR